MQEWRKKHEKKVSIKSGKNEKIKSDSMVKVTKYGNNTIEITSMLNDTTNISDYVERIDNESYKYKKTGEIRKYENHDKKTEESIKRSMNKLEKILKGNFFGNKNELFVTLTTNYEENNIKRIEQYFKDFWKRLNTKYKGLEYVYVVEKHKTREGYHIHALIKDTKHMTLIIPNTIIERYWKRGFTKTVGISRNREGFKIDEETQIICRKNNLKVDESSKGINKIIKYMIKQNSKKEMPNRCRIYHKSKGIIVPTAVTELYAIAIDKDKYYKQAERTTLICNEEGKILNSIKYETWKIK